MKDVAGDNISLLHLHSRDTKEVTQVTEDVKYVVEGDPWLLVNGLRPANQLSLLNLPLPNAGSGGVLLGLGFPLCHYYLIHMNEESHETRTSSRASGYSCR